jgi:hypothetical protein
MNLFKSVAALALVAAALPAQAAVLYSNAGPTGPVETPGAFGFSAASQGGVSVLNFTIDGYNTLDGVNWYEDDFTLSLNGNAILQLSYDLGGGGDNVIFTNLNGATVSSRYDKGGHWAIDVNIAALPLLVGNNDFLFSYASPDGDALGALGGHAGAQGLGDEGWGLSDITLNGHPAVPEPATWAMMIAGIATVGAAMRRRKTAVSFA